MSSAYRSKASGALTANTPSPLVFIWSLKQTEDICPKDLNVRLVLRGQSRERGHEEP